MGVAIVATALAESCGSRFFMGVARIGAAHPPPTMSTPLLLELFGGFFAACLALWLIALGRPSAQVAATPTPADPPLAPALSQPLRRYFLKDGALASTGLLLLRLAIGVMMIHHGQEKLADPQQFANTYVASLHLPFPLLFAYAAGLAEVVGSWLVILGLLSPIGALALTGTMAVAAYQHILTAGLNIYVLELVVLYLGGSLAVLLAGPGRFSFDAAIVADLLAAPAPAAASPAVSTPAAQAS